MASLTFPELEAALEAVRASPPDHGRLELIVCRPATDQREIVDEARLELETGLSGDSWISRKPDFERQLTLINARFSLLIGGDEDGASQAGDQLHVDFDLSEANAPAGTRLSFGDAVIEITAEPHTGCAKFSRRYGPDTLRFVNSELGRELHLRGVNARVIVPGAIRRGMVMSKSG